MAGIAAGARLATLPLQDVTPPTVVAETAVVDRVVVAAAVAAVPSTNSCITVARAGITPRTRRTIAPGRARTTTIVLRVRTLRAVLLTSTAPDMGKACGAQLDVI